MVVTSGNWCPRSRSFIVTAESDPTPVPPQGSKEARGGWLRRMPGHARVGTRTEPLIVTMPAHATVGGTRPRCVRAVRCRHKHVKMTGTVVDAAGDTDRFCGHAGRVRPFDSRRGGHRPGRADKTVMALSKVL